MSLRYRTPADLSLSRLQERLSYNACTGVFLQNVSAGRRKAGDRAGYVNDAGYRLISIVGKWHLAHRLAWFYHTHAWPVQDIDHINGCRDDNRIDNLRLCVGSGNASNAVRKTNQVGVRGVSLKRGKFHAAIKHNRKKIFLGSFETADAAGSAYRDAARRLHGAFAFIERPAAPKQEALL